MKKILTFALLLVLGLFYSCDSDFLDTKPTSSYDEETVLSTTDGLIAAVNGMHKNMYRQYNSTQSQSGAGGIYIFLDVLGEDFLLPNGGNSWFRTQYRWEDHRNSAGGTNTFIYHTYQFYYMLIANANKIIEASADATGSDADRNVAKGQALAYRALSHFALVQLYAPRYSASSAATDLGVPLMTTFTTEPQPRATVAAVYERIELDLSDAYTLLSSYSRPNKSNLNAAVVRGLQARVALAKGTKDDYANAKKYANEARTTFVASGGSLMNTTQYKEGFNNASNPEWMWGSIIISDQTLYFYAFHAFASYNFNSSNIRATPKVINSKLYAEIASTDVRSEMWQPSPTRASMADPEGSLPSNYTMVAYMNKKFAVANRSSSVADLVHMRLAEMYLIESEAKAHLGEADAATILNELIVTRDPSYDAATYASAAGRTILEEVLIQRRIELWGEGFRFTDLKRLNLPLDRTGANHVSSVAANKMKEPAGTIEWVFYFPKLEVDTNPYIKETQNP